MTNGIVERSHRSIRTTLRALVEELLLAQPRRWPEFLTRAEYKLRHKVVTLPDGQEFTPFKLVHGFMGATLLQSATEANSGIPPEMVHDIWAAPDKLGLRFEVD